MMLQQHNNFDCKRFISFVNIKLKFKKNKMQPIKFIKQKNEIV